MGHDIMAEYRRLGRPTDTNTRIRELAHAHTRDDVYPFQPAPEEDRSLAWPWPTVHNQINLVADCAPPRTFNPRRCCLRDSLIMFDLLPSTAERKRHHVIIILYTCITSNYIYIFLYYVHIMCYIFVALMAKTPQRQVAATPSLLLHTTHK